MNNKTEEVKYPQTVDGVSLPGNSPQNVTHLRILDEAKDEDILVPRVVIDKQTTDEILQLVATLKGKLESVSDGVLNDEVLIRMTEVIVTLTNMTDDRRDQIEALFQVLALQSVERLDRPITLRGLERLVIKDNPQLKFPEFEWNSPFHEKLEFAVRNLVSIGLIKRVPKIGRGRDSKYVLPEKLGSIDVDAILKSQTESMVNSFYE